MYFIHLINVLNLFLIHLNNYLNHINNLTRKRSKRTNTNYLGKSDLPIRNSSIDFAHCLPSLIAHTTKD